MLPTVWVKKSHMRFSDIFPQTVGNSFSPNVIRLLYVSNYARLQIFIQLTATSTKLCHIVVRPPRPSVRFGWLVDILSMWTIQARREGEGEVFPGPAVALDGPGTISSWKRINRTRLETSREQENRKKNRDGVLGTCTCTWVWCTCSH